MYEWAIVAEIGWPYRKSFGSASYDVGDPHPRTSAARFSIGLAILLPHFLHYSAARVPNGRHGRICHGHTGTFYPMMLAVNRDRGATTEQAESCPWSYCLVLCNTISIGRRCRLTFLPTSSQNLPRAETSPDFRPTSP